jgi:hypothetical protein
LDSFYRGCTSKLFRRRRTAIAISAASFGNDIEVIEMLNDGGKEEIESGIYTSKHLDRALPHNNFCNHLGVNIESVL